MWLTGKRRDNFNSIMCTSLPHVFLQSNQIKVYFLVICKCVTSSSSICHRIHSNIPHELLTGLQQNNWIKQHTAISIGSDRQDPSIDFKSSAEVSISTTRPQHHLVQWQARLHQTTITEPRGLFSTLKHYKYCRWRWSCSRRTDQMD